MGDVALKVNFALSKLLLGATAVLSRIDECCICIAVITMEYQITNVVHLLNSLMCLDDLHDRR